MNKTQINPYAKINRKIYGYSLPSVPSHEGLVKVGQTEKDDPRTRISQQVSTAGLNYDLLFHRNAVRNDGKLFSDSELHRYYLQRGFKRAVLNQQASEWFNFGDLHLAAELADDYINLDYTAVQVSDDHLDYILRPEQADAVNKTLDYWKNPVHGTEFLWNAKPRFGKTLTCYDFARKIKAQNVLIVTNRPAIANSWFDDFETFIAWQEPGLKFVSETDALKDRTPLSRKEFTDSLKFIREQGLEPRCLAFISLQDLKGAKRAGGQFDKLEWVFDMSWDLLVIDEAHEGIDTQKTDLAFDKITKKAFTLHLSGTPFKAIASQKFHAVQIYNWSYLDEQEAKATWDSTQEGTNPYASLPTLNLFTYQMSQVIEEEIAKGIDLDDETSLDYAFNLNEFFSTQENGKFVYEADVIRFLDKLCTGKYPFAEEEYRNKLNHTFWLLNWVDSAKAMEALLKKHPFFKDYEIVLAAGDGRSFEEEQSMDELETAAAIGTWNKRSFDRVKEAIAKHEKTITLSVGQLTTGVTIPEWTGVMMLSNIKSPALYFQAAFRAQNPYEFQNPETLEWYRKENAYIFDFAPDRTLVLFDEFANNLHDEGAKGDLAERKENIRELINFFPVIAEDEEGSMREISVEDVLTIPLQLKAVEVVKRGFMSNLLFANIGAIFAVPAQLKAILDKIQPEKNKRLQNQREVHVTDPMLNEKGEIEVKPEIIINKTNGIFGQAIYKTDVAATLEKFEEVTSREKMAEKVAKDLIAQVEEGFEKAKEDYGITQTKINREIREAEKLLASKIESNLFQAQERERLALDKFEEEIQMIVEPEIREERTKQLEEEKREIQIELKKNVEESLVQVSQNVVGKQIERQEEQKKKTTEDDVRDHLRGFARTIPAFLMAYGSSETTLANYDENIHEETFEELTSITLEEFRQLRDGIEYEDENGNMVQAPGLFDEVVFNSSIQEFFKVKEKLADYLHTKGNEDIFDYIPPQKTNQIFTPKRVVKMMVDLLQENAPDLFTSKETKFLDLYVKSGLYLTEIAKRLFVGIAHEIPDEKERIKWILENQVYGCAPSNIIYNMVKNYVYDGFPEVSNHALLELDLIPAAKDGRVKDVLIERFGKEMKFDVIIGNPPYQQETGAGGRQAIPLYDSFILESKKMEPNYISMIIPSRWFSGGLGLNEFRADMLNDKRIKFLIDYPSSASLFPGLQIKGGVCYFLWEKSYQGLCQITSHLDNFETTTTKRALTEADSGIFIRFNQAVQILRKVTKFKEKSFIELVSSQKPFGLPTNFRGQDEQTPNTIKVYQTKSIGFTSVDKIEKNREVIDKFKLFVTKGYGAGEDFPHQIINKPFIGMPGSCCTETYIYIGPFESIQIARNVLSYVKTKFFRFLVLLQKNTQDALRGVYSFVPMQNFELEWTDSDLYKKYNLDDSDILFIENMIRPM